MLHTPPFYISSFIFQASAKDRQCFCIGWNVTNWFGLEKQESSEEIKYFPWCGECIDPCALKFKWDSTFTVLKGKVVYQIIRVKTYKFK